MYNDKPVFSGSPVYIKVIELQVKLIFHYNANALAFGPCVGLSLQCETWALQIPTFWYLKSLMDPMRIPTDPTQTPTDPTRKPTYVPTRSPTDPTRREGGDVPMSDVNFNKYPSCLSLLTEPVVSVIGHYIHFLFFLFCIFRIIIIWSRKKKRNRCDLKKISYNRVNSNFFLSLSKVCPRLICSGGIYPRGYIS